MVARYGSSLAKTLLLLLRGYDDYYRWKRTLDLPTTDQQEDKVKIALQMATAGTSPSDPQHDVHAAPL
eukprot:6211019-Pleurochrysis_carterae.AAC.4